MWELYELPKQRRRLHYIFLINFWWVLLPPLEFPARQWLMVIGKPTTGQLYVWLCASLQINITTDINMAAYVKYLRVTRKKNEWNGYDFLTPSVTTNPNKSIICSYSLSLSLWWSNQKNDKMCQCVEIFRITYILFSWQATWLLS